MEIAIASGKGGTGKTTVAVNLALSQDLAVVLADCDVEEPNAHLFLQPEWLEKQTVTVLNPVVDPDKCVGTGACRDACRFKALIMLGQEPLLFPELCHSCGACVQACPHQAISEVDREIGLVEVGSRSALRCIQGKLNVGEARSTPVIEAVRKRCRQEKTDLVILDAPPGTSCPVIATLRGVDYVVLVTEPTPFGLHDLELAVQTVRRLELTCGVVINRADIGDNKVLNYCQQNGVRVLAQIPYNRTAAELYARGKLLVEHDLEFKRIFRELSQAIREALP
ncbi:ATP-binding protein [bacterium]|nr:ATP-binding protein [bacterium]